MLKVSTLSANKVLSNASEEYRHILEVVQCYAVHNPTVQFRCGKRESKAAKRGSLRGGSLRGAFGGGGGGGSQDAFGGGDTQNDVRTAGGSGTGSRDVLAQLYGQSVASNLIELRFQSPSLNELRVEGWISGPSYVSGKQQKLILFINNRLVENGLLKKALSDKYAEVLGKGPAAKGCFCYLDVQIRADAVDVNVHPTKKEVHFMDEELVLKEICSEVDELLAERCDGRMLGSLGAGLGGLGGAGGGKKSGAAGGSGGGSAKGSAGAGSDAASAGTFAGLNTLNVTRVRTDTRQVSMRDFFNAKTTQHLQQLLSKRLNQSFMRRLSAAYRRYAVDHGFGDEVLARPSFHELDAVVGGSGSAAGGGGGGGGSAGVEASQEGASQGASQGGSQGGSLGTAGLDRAARLQTQNKYALKLEEEDDDMTGLSGPSGSTPGDGPAGASGGLSSGGPSGAADARKARRFPLVFRRCYLDFERWDLGLSRNLQRSVFIGVVDAEKCLLQLGSVCVVVNMCVLAEESAFQLLMLLEYAGEPVPALQFGAAAVTAVAAPGGELAAADGLDVTALLRAYFRRKHAGGAGGASVGEKNGGGSAEARASAAVARVTRVLARYRFALARSYGLQFAVVDGASDADVVVLEDDEMEREAPSDSRSLVGIAGLGGEVGGTFGGRSDGEWAEQVQQLQLVQVPNLFSFNGVCTARLLRKLPAFLVGVADALEKADRARVRWGERAAGVSGVGSASDATGASPEQGHDVVMELGGSGAEPSKSGEKGGGGKKKATAAAKRKATAKAEGKKKSCQPSSKKAGGPAAPAQEAVVLSTEAVTETDSDEAAVKELEDVVCQVEEELYRLVAQFCVWAVRPKTKAGKAAVPFLPETLRSAQGGDQSGAQSGDQSKSGDSPGLAGKTDAKESSDKGESGGKQSDEKKTDEIDAQIAARKRKMVEECYDYLHEFWKSFHLAPWFRARCEWIAVPGAAGTGTAAGASTGASTVAAAAAAVPPATPAETSDAKGPVCLQIVALEQLYRVFERC